jgi:hypothetical protein
LAISIEGTRTVLRPVDEYSDKLGFVLRLGTGGADGGYDGSGFRLRSTPGRSGDRGCVTSPTESCDKAFRALSSSASS